MHMYKKQADSKQMLLENLNLLQRLEKVSSNMKATDHEEHWADVQQKQARLKINRDSRVNLIDGAAKRAHS